LNDTLDIMDDISNTGMPASVGASTTSTRVLEALTQLRVDIISGTLKPGEKLRVQHLKSKYDVGAATLREALSLLVSESLVTSTAQRGFNVAPISLGDLTDISATRTMLEVQAAVESVENGNEEWEIQLKMAYHRLTKVEEKTENLASVSTAIWEQRNIEFHEALVAACPSRWIKQFRLILHTHSERYRRLSLQTVGVSRNVHIEHQKIFNAAMARDTDELVKVLTNHIKRTFDVVYQMVKEDPSLNPII
jgi:GntR family carbon starvation induced transcriptional regulator